MMQSMKHIAYRILQLLSAILVLALAAGLINQNGPFAAVPKILKWIMILGFVSCRDVLLLYCQQLTHSD